ncbi:bucky ball-like [Phyllopteryx taeniolatus]|uniref:bucky ball-like n=1 Tax=Phyllopteryx taeniolatus TaxID=161469 RepID=UPI002AD4849F|nr:bucky ball-like [Phyllopteryx taeniolatus]
MRAELLCPKESIGMEAATSNVHTSYGLGPRVPNMPHGPPRGAPQAREPPGEPRPEEHQQQGHKPLFYFQPSQAYLPLQGLQWPLPMALPVGYNPYYGGPPLGYGMPMMPHYQPNPYMEPPAFVLPHTHLHLTDYRRMLNPYYYQTMAYHARRYRYQHSAPAKEVTSCEVQTEPLAGLHLISNPGSGNTEPSGVPNVCGSEDTPGGPPNPPLQSDLTVQSNDKPFLDVGTPPNGFVIQTEEVTIECCTTPVGLQLHSCETAEVSNEFCMDDGPGIPEEQMDKACPDIVLVGTPGEIPKMEETKKNKDSFTGSNFSSKVEVKDQEDLQLALKSIQSQVVLQEEQMLSVEDTLVRSLDSSTPTEEHGTLHVAELPTDETPTGDTGLSMEDEMVCEAEVCYKMEESPYLEMKHKAEGLSHGLESSQKEDETQHRQDCQEQQDTSFESLPTYLPSSSWLADFDRVYIYSRMPPTPKKQNQTLNRTALEVPTRRRKLELEYREQPSVHKTKERYKPKGKMDRRSLSDHECCLTRTFENIFTLKNDRLCSRCLAKPGPSLKRKAVPFQQCNQSLMSTCDTCKSHTSKRLQRKGSVPDIRAPHRGLGTEGESSENGSCCAGLKRRPNGKKRPLGSKQNWDKNCSCEEAQPRQVEAWKRLCLCPHGNAMQELDENLPASPQDKWRHADKFYWAHRWETEKSWKTVTASPDCTRSPHLNKRNMSQSQGNQRKDTRC